MDPDTARQRAFEVILDPTNTEHLVSLPTLKRLCARGIPDWPVQWRPLSWELLLGVRGREKGNWDDEERDRWAEYYQRVDKVTSELGNSHTNDAELLAIDDAVRALARTDEGKWLLQHLKYPPDHPLTRSSDREAEDAFPPVHNAQGIKNHIHSLRTGAKHALEPTHSPEITLSPSPGDNQKPTHRQLRGPRTKPAGKAKPLTLVVPPTSIVVTAASPTIEGEITLIPSRPITPALEETKEEETLADGLVRLLAVSIHQSPSRDAGQLVSLANTLFALFTTGGDTDVLASDLETGEHAEAEAYACLRAVVGDAGVHALMSDEGRKEAGERLAKRVFWADEGLYRVLMALHLDLRKDVFIHEWLGHLLSRTVPRDQLLQLWDVIFSEDEDPTTVPPGTSGKTELLLDICTAMLLLLKDTLRGILETPHGRGGFWIDGEQDRLLFDPDVPDLPADQGEERTARARGMLRAYPMREVDVEEVVRVAWEVRQGRVMALLEGEDLEGIVLPVVERYEEEDGLASRLESLAIKAGSSVRDSMNPLPRYTTSPLVVDTVKNTITSSGERLKDYAAALQESDAAARVSKVSSNLTAVALMRLNSLAGKQEDAGWSSAASRLWRGKADPESSMAAPTPEVATDNAINTEPAALFRRDTNLPPSFITPRGSIIYPAGRYRPKAQTTGTAKPSLQSRLAAVASSPAVPPAAVSPERASAVRPLILSRSAKPASPLHVDGGKSAVGRMSPSPSMQTLDVVENYVSRRVSVSRRSQRSSLGSVDREAPGDGTDSTSARLRKATRDSYTADARRYHLSDPGAKEEETPVVPTESAGQTERYQLRDGAIPAEQSDAEAESRRQSVVDDSIAGVSRSKVVRKGKFASKAAHNRLQSAGHIDVGEAKNGADTTDELPVRTSSLSQPATPVAVNGTPKSLILPERPERSSSLQNRTADEPGFGREEDDEPLGAKDGYGDLLESYAAALESL